MRASDSKWALGERSNLVGVVGRLLLEVAFRESAAPVGAEPVDHGRVGLKRHTALESVVEHGTHEVPIALFARLLLDNGRKNEKLVGTLQGARQRAPRLPGGSKKPLLAINRHAKYREVARTRAVA